MALIGFGEETILENESIGRVEVRVGKLKNGKIAEYYVDSSTFVGVRGVRVSSLGWIVGETGESCPLGCSMYIWI